MKSDLGPSYPRALTKPESLGSEQWQAQILQLWDAFSLLQGCLPQANIHLLCPAQTPILVRKGLRPSAEGPGLEGGSWPEGWAERQGQDC